jgi:N-methylhydantoinase A
LVLGKLDPDAFAGGSMRLDVAAARGAVQVAVGGPAGLTVENAAWAVTETVAETMASAAGVHCAELGAEVTARTVIAFGGAAPLHAARFAEKLGISCLVVPPGAGVGSAIGFLRAPVAFEIVRTRRVLLHSADWAAVGGMLAEMEDAARAVLGISRSATTWKPIRKRASASSASSRRRDWRAAAPSAAGFSLLISGARPRCRAAGPS